MELAPNVHLIPKVTGNSYLLVGPDGLTLIDTGFPRSDRKILRYIEALGFAPGDLRSILITHADPDHVGGLAALREATGAMIYASPMEAKAIARGGMSRELRLRGWRKAILGLASAFMRPEPAQVDILLEEGQMLPALGGPRGVETPGHSPGHLSFLAMDSRALFVGDSLRSGRDGLEVSRGWNTWDESQALASARLQAELSPRWVCPGHGPVLEVWRLEAGCWRLEAGG